MFFNESKYVFCSKRKGFPRKHVYVCLDCKWKKKCSSYKNYFQPELFPIFEKQHEKNL